MPVSVLTNAIGMPDHRQAVERAALQGIGQRSGNWVVQIFEPQLRPDYVVQIEAPAGFEWERTFSGPVEQTPEFRRDEVAKALKG